MSHWSAVAFFCHYLHSDRDESDTIVGTLPENIEVVSLPAAIPSLGLYVRIHFDPDEPIEGVRIALCDVEGKKIIDQEIEQGLIYKSIEAAKIRKPPLVALVFKASLANFLLAATGRFLVTVSVAGETRTVGSLNVSLLGN